MNEEQLKPDQHRLQPDKTGGHFLQAVSGRPHGEPQKEEDNSTQPRQRFLQASGWGWNAINENPPDALIGKHNGQHRQYQQYSNKQRNAAFRIAEQEGILRIARYGKQDCSDNDPLKDREQQEEFNEQGRLSLH